MHSKANLTQGLPQERRSCIITGLIRGDTDQQIITVCRLEWLHLEEEIDDCCA